MKALGTHLPYQFPLKEAVLNKKKGSYYPCFECELTCVTYSQSRENETGSVEPAHPVLPSEVANELHRKGKGFAVKVSPGATSLWKLAV